MLCIVYYTAIMCISMFNKLKYTIIDDVVYIMLYYMFSMLIP